MRWIDLFVFACRDVASVGVNPELSARPRIELCADPHPFDELRGVDEVGKNGGRRSCDPLLDLDREAALDQLLDELLSSASASSRSRSMSRAHMPRRYASRGLSAARSALYSRLVPSRRSVTSPDSRRTRRFWEIAGQLTSNADAIWPAVCSRAHTRRRISRRLGLERAARGSAGLGRDSTCTGISISLRWNLIKSSL
jgi:hypothetical protein